MRIGLSFLLLSLVLSAVGVAQTTPSDTDLLITMDAQRFFDPAINSIRVQVDSTTPEQTSSAELRLYFAERDNADYTRIEFVSPAALAGQIYLSTPDGTYFYGPNLDSPIKTSTTTAVFGDASVAQTSGIQFAADYTVVSRQRVTQSDGSEALEVDLKAVNASVAFQSVTVLVDPASYRPISATLYALSGVPYYDVYYEAYATHGESDVYVSVQRIVNRVLTGRETTSRILEIGNVDLPADWFDPQSLGS
jgi:outer membrane lipoprotein-sorting protein